MFKEELGPSKAMAVIVDLIAVILVGAFVVVLFFKHNSLVPTIVLVVVGIGVPASLPFFRSVVTVSDNVLILKLRPVWRKNLVISSEVQAGIGTVDPLREFGGYGLRSGRKNRVGKPVRGLVMRGGTAIVIDTPSRQWVVSTRRPGEFLEALKSAGVEVR